MIVNVLGTLKVVIIKFIKFRIFEILNGQLCECQLTYVCHCKFLITVSVIKF